MVRTNDFYIGIKNFAATVEQELGQETIRFILDEYGGGASSIENLPPCYYESVWNELFDIERDMKE